MDFSQGWVYRGEGNANLVLALPQEKKVLRLAKIVVNKEDLDASSIDPELHVGYIHLMSTLFGAAYSSGAEAIDINRMERDLINLYTMAFRPVERLHKAFCGNFGLILADATQLPDSLIRGLKFASEKTFSVEIKPKQGWLLQDLDLSANILDLKGLKKCRYCSLQFLKLKTGEISQISEYCPMDIFSGEYEKITKALKALIKNPQNNFRLFENGRLIYSKESPSVDIGELLKTVSEDRETLFYDLIIHCLLNDYGDKTAEDENTIENLPFNCVLRKILKMQIWSKENIKSVHAEYQKTCSKKKTYNYLENLLSKQGLGNIISKMTPLEKYSLGATAMDCSLLITFRRLRSENLSEFLRNRIERNLFTWQDRIYLTNVTVLDLDPKPDNHFAKYIRQTNDAYETAKNN